MIKHKKQQREPSARRCGLCGKTKKLMQTECCGNWICDDEGNYALFSYARNSCARNHRRYTLCASHHTEEHRGNWNTCDECKKGVHPEMYDWDGANEYNFEKLDELLPFTLIHCEKCRSMIFQSQEGYSSLPDGTYRCERCSPLP